MNAIFIIKPFRFHGQWVINDEARGLEREPFVAGADVMIDRAVVDIPNAASGFLAIFSASRFPGAAIALEWVREEAGGNWYRWAETKLEGWLCPALGKYLEPAPKKLFIQVKPAN